MRQQLLKKREELIDRMNEFQDAKNACFEDEDCLPLPASLIDHKKARSISKMQDAIARDIAFIDHQLKRA